MPPRTPGPSAPQGETLDEYRQKRRFDRTREPAPHERRGDAGPLTFVVQKHSARQLHYDFRLELNGVLKSWSVPKGPSLDPQQKRLAVMVEDHPLDYASFEGAIPKGEYGAGQVIVWDNGTYSPEEDGRLSFHDRAEAEARTERGLAEGKVSLVLRGRKLKGSWALVKMHRGERDWLLFKHRDRSADPERDVLADDRSVVSGLSIQDLKAGCLPKDGPRVAVAPQALPGVEPATFPRSASPMLATATDAAFSSPDWLFEPKLDGVRALALIRDGEVRLLSRRSLDIARQYPALLRDLAAQPGRMVLDGEIVALDEAGRPSFQRLQQRLNLTNDADIRLADAQVPVLYYVFDVLHLDGFDLRPAALEQRKSLLERAVLFTDQVRPVEHFEGDGEAAYEAATGHGLEGVVAKRRDSAYESGRRSRRWLKVKAGLTGEFVVAGYSEGMGNRSDTFGSLVLGFYDNEGRLAHAGNVGSGFDDATLAALRRRLDAIRSDTCPFEEVPPSKTATTWLRPEVVAEVKFAQWTDDGHLRAPVFLRLREDKSPREVARVEVVSTPAGDAQPEGEAAGVLEQLSDRRSKFPLEVQGHRLPLTNLDKELWPALGDRPALTKRDFLVYLASVSPYVLPHLRDRPLTLIRYPNSIEGKHFYQKHSADPPPDFVETVRLFSGHNESDQEYLLCNNLPTLLWLGQLAVLELHTWYSRVSPSPDGHHLSTEFSGSLEAIRESLLHYPDFIVFDLDPYIFSGREAKGEEPEMNRPAFEKTCEAALWLKDILDSIGLPSFVKTTGRTGLHVYVPIMRQLEYEGVRAACETIGRFLLQQHPREITMEWAVEKRTGKVFFDHNQNVRGKTLASVYSPRALPEAAVSMPLRWDELGSVYPTDFTILTAPGRLAEVGDLWGRILDAKHDLKALLDTLEG